MSEALRIVENPDARAWDAFVAARGGHLLQSAAWGALKARFGWSALRLALARGDTVLAGAQMLFRRLVLGLVLAYVPRGPVADPDDHAAFGALFDALCAAARARGAFALKIEPNTPSPLSLPRTAGEGLRVGVGFQPLTTIHVDLTRDGDAILAHMKPKWRYNIRLAERKGITVRVGSLEDIPTFYRLLRVTGERDAFAIHSLEYYRAAYDLLVACEYARLLIAEYEGKALAALFVTAFGGEAIYLYGASGSVHRERMPNHALHWAAMQWAKSRGCTRYDLWGIPDQNAEVSQQKADTGAVRPDQHPPSLREVSGEKSKDESPLPDGLYQFKQGFGGAVVRYAGAYDVVFSRTRHALYRRALALRRGGLV